MFMWKITRNAARMMRIENTKSKEWLEIYYESIDGKKKYFVDLITRKKIKALGEFNLRSSAIAFAVNYTNKNR